MHRGGDTEGEEEITNPCQTVSRSRGGLLAATQGRGAGRRQEETLGSGAGRKEARGSESDSRSRRRSRGSKKK